jgi:hypothetical protein
MRFTPNLRRSVLVLLAAVAVAGLPATRDTYLGI